MRRPLFVMICALSALTAACDGERTIRITSTHTGDDGPRGVLKMVDALQRVHAMPRGAVIKAATDGGSANILLLEGFGKLPNGSMQFKVDRHDGARWRRFRWATEAVLSQARPNPNPDP